MRKEQARGLWLAQPAGIDAPHLKSAALEIRSDGHHCSLELAVLVGQALLNELLARHCQSCRLPVLAVLELPGVSRSMIFYGLPSVSSVAPICELLLIAWHRAQLLHLFLHDRAPNLVSPVRGRRILPQVYFGQALEWALAPGQEFALLQQIAHQARLRMQPFPPCASVCRRARLNCPMHCAPLRKRACRRRPPCCFLAAP